MSFFNSKPWAKIPTDLLENKAMIRAEKELAPELRSAPALFYLAGATKADDDGIFDVGDGEEFSALIKVDSPETVRAIASAMVKLRIFAHVPESSIYIFVEWDYSTRKESKPLRERFALASKIWASKLEENKYFCSMSKNVDTLTKVNNHTVNKCFNTIQGEVNECSNTIQAPAAPNPQNRREREDKRETEETRPENIKADVEKTHTRVEGVGGEESTTGSEPLAGSPPVASESSSDNEQNNQESDRLINIPDWSILPEQSGTEKPLPSPVNKEKEDASFMPEEIEKIKGEAFNIFQDFFHRSNTVYNADKGAKVVRALIDELEVSVDNPADIPSYVRQICENFKKMNEDKSPSNRWVGIPLFPKYLQNEAVWAYLLSKVHETVEPDKGEVLTRAEGAQQLDETFRKYGIDPNDPNATIKLLQAKKNGRETSGNSF